MEKKLITEMKFMMERLESPRMTYTQYEKKRNNLIKENYSGGDIKKWLKQNRGKKTQLNVGDGKFVGIDGDKVQFVDPTKGPYVPKTYSVDKILEMPEENIENLFGSDVPKPGESGSWWN